MASRHIGSSANRKLARAASYIRAQKRNESNNADNLDRNLENKNIITTLEIQRANERLGDSTIKFKPATAKTPESGWKSNHGNGSQLRLSRVKRFVKRHTGPGHTPS